MKVFQAVRMVLLGKGRLVMIPPNDSLFAIFPWCENTASDQRSGGISPPRISGRQGAAVNANHGILFQGSRFWVTHRRRRFGPFDYEWSKDFAGIELMFAGRKFGEYCSSDEIFADLKEFRLPAVVSQAATVVMGCLVFGVLNGLRENERERLIVDQLSQRGLSQFACVEIEPDPRPADRCSPEAD
jgi:hypothetical protein